MERTQFLYLYDYSWAFNFGSQVRSSKTIWWSAWVCPEGLTRQFGTHWQLQEIQILEQEKVSNETESQEDCRIKKTVFQINFINWHVESFNKIASSSRIGKSIRWWHCNW